MTFANVEAYYSNLGYWHLLLTPPAAETTYLVSIDTSTGNPFYTGIPYVDLFPERSIGQEYLMRQFQSTLKIRGHGLIGMVQSEQTTAVIIVDKSEETAVLPGGHSVRTIRHAFYVNIPLPGAPQKLQNPIEEFQLTNNHYFCDTFDLTQPFIGPHDHPDLAFSWNESLVKPFAQLGLQKCCLRLIQGICTTYDGNGWKETYIARRSVLNPGTRYLARGLNELNSPGNELECELIFEKDNEVWSNIWRRGSVPIRWKTTLTSKIATPQHVVEADFFNGTPEYFKDLLTRYGNESFIKCVSLLARGVDKAEYDVFAHFEKALGMLFDHGVKNVSFCPFDLNSFLHADGSNETMKDFLTFIGDPGGFNHQNDRQTIICRFNCADSLDRTNLATFYYAMMVTADWCREHSIGLSKTPDADQPNLCVEQKVIDFLARAFVTSGNIISYLYTNTPAIKVEAIRKFAPIIESSSNDSLLSVQRRLENVVNDPVRMRTIDLWTHPPAINWFYRLPHTHLFLVPKETTVPPALFGARPQPYEFAPGSALVALPMPMSIFAIMLLIYPTQRDRNLKSISVSGGLTGTDMKHLGTFQLPNVDSPSWLRFKIGRPEKWGLQHLPVDFVRFLKIDFISNKPTVVVGNVKLEMQAPYAAQSLKASFNEKTDEEGRFLDSLSEFSESPQKLPDVIKLEQNRLTLSLPITKQIDFAVSHNMNPWLFDSAGQIASKLQTCCANCGYEFTSEYYSISPLHQGLLMPLKDGEKKLGFCKKCGEEISPYASFYASFENLSRLPCPPIFKANSHFPDQRSRHSVLTLANSAFLSYPSDGVGDPYSLFLKDGGSFKLPAGTHHFDLFCLGQSILLDLAIKSNPPVSIKGDIQSFQDFPIVSFDVECETETDLIKIDVKGAVTQQIDEPSGHIANNLQGPVGTATGNDIRFNQANRTQELSLYRVGKVRGSTIEIQSPAQSLIFGFYLSGELVKSKQIILPEVRKGVRLWYEFDETIEADRAKVFYLDRAQSVQPHLIKLLFA